MTFDSIPSGTKNKGAENNSVPSKSIGFNIDDIKKKWLNNNIIIQKLCCLIIGTDGSAKSGIALDYLTDEDIKAGKRALIIDLDGGCDSLLLSHHKERCEKLGKKLNDVFILKNPLEENINGEIDYKLTFNNIREGVFLAKHAYKELNLKCVIFDGLSTALKHAEQQMRLDKNIDTDGGVMLRYWLVRNKIFVELLEQIKSIPISSFFIAHEDFVLKTKEELLKSGEKNSAVKEKTNALCHQKIFCKRVDDKVEEKIRFKTTIMKSKYKAESEGAEVEILTVNKKEKTKKWDTTKLYELLF